MLDEGSLACLPAQWPSAGEGTRSSTDSHASLRCSALSRDPPPSTDGPNQDRSTWEPAPIWLLCAVLGCRVIGHPGCQPHLRGQWQTPSLPRPCSGRQGTPGGTSRSAGSDNVTAHPVAVLGQQVVVWWPGFVSFPRARGQHHLMRRMFRSCNRRI